MLRVTVGYAFSTFSPHFISSYTGSLLLAVHGSFQYYALPSHCHGFVPSPLRQSFLIGKLLCNDTR
jgi:hypothetical protein